MISIPIDIGIDNLFKYLNFQKDDIILYLGGRIDDNNLYPSEYKKYLNTKIKELKPNKIICHTHWYAKKYYDGGILEHSTKIDMVTAFHKYFLKGPEETINIQDYQKHADQLKKMTTINPNMIYAAYMCHSSPIPFSGIADTITIDDSVCNSFVDGYNLNNIKYFYFCRTYCPKELVDWSDKHSYNDEILNQKINATDGFAIINAFLRAGFKNLNILGFSAFGANEDSSHFTAYNLEDPIFKGLKYFDIKTSENQRIEADILKKYVEQKKINNLENYDKLIYYLEKK